MSLDHILKNKCESLSHFQKNVSLYHIRQIVMKNVSQKESLFDDYLDTFDVVENENCISL